MLYAWSIFAANLRDGSGWSGTQASLPYTTAVAMFAVMMIFGGRLQDRYGPRVAVTLAGMLVGAGMVLSSIFPTVTGLVLSFGVLSGSGIGLGYSATTPVAVKWFPRKRRPDLRLVVAASSATIYIAPLTNYLIESYDVFAALRILGVSFFVVVVGLAQTLKNPDAPLTTGAVKARSQAREYTWKEMIRTGQFYQLWIMFLAGSLAGLMIIGHLSSIARVQTGRNIGFLLVALMAISNALGRPIAGSISDRLGRARTMMILYIAQGTVLLFFSKFTGFASILFGAATVTFAYGAMLSVYPSAVGTSMEAKPRPELRRSLYRMGSGRSDRPDDGRTDTGRNRRLRRSLLHRRGPLLRGGGYRLHPEAGEERRLTAVIGVCIL